MTATTSSNRSEPANRPEPEARFDLVFVIGVAHCGSTLLGRLLNGHSRIHCPGELMRLDLALEEDLPCGCGARLPECPFWTRHLDWIRSDYGNDHARFGKELYGRLAGPEGADVSIDLSKTRAWRATRRWKDPRVGYVLLLRDSRGILSSAARVGKSLDRPLKKHAKWMRRLPRFVRKLGERGLTLRYEDLCSQPEAVLRRVAGFLGVEYEPEMLRPADSVHHFVHSSSSGYLKNQNEIRLDERWRRELDADTLARIERAMSDVPALREAYLSKQPA